MKNFFKKIPFSIKFSSFASILLFLLTFGLCFLDKGSNEFGCFGIIIIFIALFPIESYSPDLAEIIYDKPLYIVLYILLSTLIIGFIIDQIFFYRKREQADKKNSMIISLTLIVIISSFFLFLSVNKPLDSWDSIHIGENAGKTNNLKLCSTKITPKTVKHINEREYLNDCLHTATLISNNEEFCHEMDESDYGIAKSSCIENLKASQRLSQSKFCDNFRTEGDYSYECLMANCSTEALNFMNFENCFVDKAIGVTNVGSQEHFVAPDYEWCDLITREEFKLSCIERTKNAIEWF